MKVKFCCGFDGSLKNNRFWKINGQLVGTLALVASVCFLVKCFLMPKSESQTFFENPFKLRIVCGAFIVANLSWIYGLAKNINELMLVGLLFYTTALFCHFLLLLKYSSLFPTIYLALATGISVWFYVVAILSYKSTIFYKA
ncbi:uncharacterized protein LOC129573409 [Sitodiplosis mosellana]|uniref:uncharacterized protein LOC129573409 n=1 Tax=Sitodiplosis mosellana TaxID=263140 RepID=UPI002443B5DD|nr:uncharacterized protein LOC129573409 [Sitodiplosis mosellana]